MNREDIIRMAREAGIYLDGPFQSAVVGETQIAKLATLVAAAATEEANRRANASWTHMCEKMVAAERKACAKLIDGSQDGITFMGDRWVTVQTAIRSRRQA